jgi:hypothetical protein
MHHPWTTKGVRRPLGCALLLGAHPSGARAPVEARAPTTGRGLCGRPRGFATGPPPGHPRVPFCATCPPKPGLPHGEDRGAGREALARAALGARVRHPMHFATPPPAKGWPSRPGDVPRARPACTNYHCVYCKSLLPVQGSGTTAGQTPVNRWRGVGAVRCELGAPPRCGTDARCGAVDRPARTRGQCPRGRRGGAARAGRQRVRRRAGPSAHTAARAWGGRRRGGQTSRPRRTSLISYEARCAPTLLSSTYRIVRAGERDDRSARAHPAALPGKTASRQPRVYGSDFRPPPPAMATCAAACAGAPVAAPGARRRRCLNACRARPRAVRAPRGASAPARPHLRASAALLRPTPRPRPRPCPTPPRRRARQAALRRTGARRRHPPSTTALTCSSRRWARWSAARSCWRSASLRPRRTARSGTSCERGAGPGTAARRAERPSTPPLVPAAVRRARGGTRRPAHPRPPRRPVCPPCGRSLDAAQDAICDLQAQQEAGRQREQRLRQEVGPRATAVRPRRAGARSRRRARWRGANAPPPRPRAAAPPRACQVARLSTLLEAEKLQSAFSQERAAGALGEERRRRESAERAQRDALLQRWAALRGGRGPGAPGRAAALNGHGAGLPTGAGAAL